MSLLQARSRLTANSIYYRCNIEKWWGKHAGGNRNKTGGSSREKRKGQHTTIDAWFLRNETDTGFIVLASGKHPLSKQF